MCGVAAYFMNFAIAAEQQVHLNLRNFPLTSIVNFVRRYSKSVMFNLICVTQRTDCITILVMVIYSKLAHGFYFATHVSCN